MVKVQVRMRDDRRILVDIAGGTKGKRAVEIGYVEIGMGGRLVGGGN